MVAPTQTSLVPTFQGNNVALYTWTALAQSSSGSPISGPGYTDRSVQVTGLFDAATMVLQGSNDNTNWFTLHDPFGNALSFTTASFAEVTEVALWMRPTVNGGDSGTALTVIVLCSNHSPN